MSITSWCWGQYGPGAVGGREVPGYRAEADVSPSSTTPTFFAGKFLMDNLRWAGVPFYLRTGKRLPRRVTEICIEFKRLPLRLFGRTCDVMEPNVLFLTIQPDEKIALRFLVKYPFSANQLYSVRMDFSYEEAFKMPRRDAYERILLDVIKGDLTLFVREDTIEEMWEVVDPINRRWETQRPGDFPNYAAGTWGPEAAGAHGAGRQVVAHHVMTGGRGISIVVFDAPSSLHQYMVEKFREISSAAAAERRVLHGGPVGRANTRRFLQ